MDILFYVFATATGIAAALASLAIWAPRPTRVRVLALVITTLFIPVIYVEMIEMLSKPMSFEWFERNTDKAVLLGTSLDEAKRSTSDFASMGLSCRGPTKFPGT